MTMSNTRDAIHKIHFSKMIQEQVFVEALDCVVKLSCLHLPRDCQIEIMKMMSPTPLPPALLRNKSYHNQKGFVLKLLPESKKLHQQPADPSQKVLSSFEKAFYELRESFSIGLHQMGIWTLSSI